MAVPLVLVVSHLMHGTLIGLHEATHGLLRKNRNFNEFDGVVIGMLSLMSFSLYRVVHQTHHAYLSTERDYEFWPLSQTDDTAVETVSGCILRTEFRIVLRAVCFPARLFVFAIAGAKQARSPAHLGRTRSDRSVLDAHCLGGRSIRSMEIFHLDVSRAGTRRRQFAKLAQIYRARRA